MLYNDYTAMRLRLHICPGVLRPPRAASWPGRGEVAQVRGECFLSLDLIDMPLLARTSAPARRSRTRAQTSL